jgi:hypothetical protein
VVKNIRKDELFPVVKSQEAGNRIKNDELYPLVAAQNKAAMDEMILLNMAMVKYSVNTFVDRNPGFAFLKADLISSASVGLVKAVNRMAGIPDKDGDPIPTFTDKPNPTSFIGFYIFLYIGKLVEEESLVHVPGRVRRDRKKKGKEIFVPNKEESIDSTFILERDGLRDPRTVVDLTDEIMGCCETNIEREIIQHRIEGRSDQEISDILGVPRISLNLMRRQIYQRFKDRNEEYASSDD